MVSFCGFKSIPTKSNPSLYLEDDAIWDKPLVEDWTPTRAMSTCFTSCKKMWDDPPYVGYVGLLFSSKRWTSNGRFQDEHPSPIGISCQPKIWWLEQPEMGSFCGDNHHWVLIDFPMFFFFLCSKTAIPYPWDFAVESPCVIHNDSVSFFSLWISHCPCPAPRYIMDHFGDEVAKVSKKLPTKVGIEYDSTIKNIGI